MHVGRARGFTPNASTYFGSGSVENLKKQAVNQTEIFINAILTGIQVRNLEMELGVRVLDRIGLIVNIFAQRARTKEAKLQVCCKDTIRKLYRVSNRWNWHACN